jgi:rhodanese-related sulfurtransferase
MTDRYRVYTKVKKTLKTMMKLDHQGQVVTLAMMIAGIVLSRKAQLSVMSSEIPTATQEKSVEMRMRRWVKDELDVEAVYMPFARQILEALCHLPLVLVMGGSQAGRACAPAAAPAEVTEAPVVVTEAPAEAVIAPDAQALFTDLVAGLPADKGLGSVKPAALNEELADKAPFILDVREAAEIEKDGYIEGSVNIPVREALNNLDKLPGLDEPIVVTCASGHRGGMVMAALKLLGYTNVRNLNGGLNGWIAAKLPVVK